MESPNDIKDLKLLVSVLLKRIDDLENEIVAFRSENGKLRDKNSALQSRLKLNSKNSHKPPTSDGLSKKQGLPKAATKKTGGQKGHTGTALRMVEQPDEVVIHHAVSCPCCNKQFSGADVTSIVHKRQVFDTPETSMEVTEHQLGTITCCGQTLYGAFPEKVSQLVRHGSRIKALIVLLNSDYKLPLQKIEQLIHDLWGCESTVMNTNAGIYDSLQVVGQEIRENILATKLAHFDETGMRLSKKLHWFHVVSTEIFIYLFVHSHRGKAALESKNSLLKDYAHRTVYDCGDPYFNFPNCKYVLCGAHLLRELSNLLEKGSEWASKMHQFILRLYKHTRHEIINKPERETCLQEFEQICQMADRQEPQPIQKGRENTKNSKGRNLLNRLTSHRDVWIDFAFVPDIPFTNHQADRDIRHLKTKQKVATNFQIFKSALHYAHIQSFCSTLRKHSINVFQNFIKILDGDLVVFQVG
jgi:transposase